MGRASVWDRCKARQASVVQVQVNGVNAGSLGQAQTYNFLSNFAVTFTDPGVMSVSLTGVGTVTSVALSLPSIFTLTGSPITTSGTFTATLATQSAALVFASPGGIPGPPSFRALLSGDLPTNVLGSAAVGATPNANGMSISAWTITLQPADNLNPGVLTAVAQTIGGNKTFVGSISASNLSGTNSGDVSFTAVGAAPSANGATLSGQAITLQPADATHPGLLTAGTQSIGGAKTFNATMTISGASFLTSGVGTFAESAMLHASNGWADTTVASRGAGAYVGWNRTAGQGEYDFVNHHGGGAGGYNWYDTDGVTYTLVMSMTTNGTLSPAFLKFTTNQSFPGALAATGGYGYSNASLGFVLYGFGTTNDVTICNRSGTGVISVAANSTVASFGGTIQMPNTTEQKINLWSTSYAFGVQPGALYLRSGGAIYFYENGVYSATPGDPGAGGTVLATLTAKGEHSAIAHGDTLKNWGVVGASVALDFTLGGIQAFQTTSATACTVSATLPTYPGHYAIRVAAPATGTSPSITWPATVKGSPPTTVTLAKQSMLNFVFDGTSLFYVGGALNV